MKPQTSLAAARPALSPVTALVLAVALALAAMLAMPAPAQAHDTLLSSDPADGSTLETSPEQIAFTYSSDILDVSPLVRVTDESGTELYDIVPTVDGPVATAELPEPLPAGSYDIQWRVVSGDGHPIEGTLALTIEQDTVTQEPAEEGAAASDAGGAATDDAQPTDETQPAEAEPTAASSEGDQEDSGLPMPLLLGLLAVVVLGVVVVGAVIMRRRD